MASRVVRALDVGLLAGVMLTAAGGWQILFKQPKGRDEEDAMHSTNNVFGAPRTQIEGALFEAAARGDCQKIEEVVAIGAPVDVTDPRFLRTPLCVAASMSQPAACSTLLRLGADVNHRDRHGMAPLELACWKGHAHVARALLESGADHSSVDLYGVTALHKAAAFGHVEAVRLLVEHAKERGEAIDPPLGESHSTPGNYERSLHISAAKGFHRVLEVIIDQGGVAVDTTDHRGCTALHHGCDQPAVVKALLGRGANRSALCAGRTALEMSSDQECRGLLAKVDGERR